MGQFLKTEGNRYKILNPEDHPKLVKIDLASLLQHTPAKIAGAEQVSIKELPICVLLFASEQFGLEELSESVTEQNYSNQRIVVPTRNGTSNSSSDKNSADANTISNRLQDSNNNTRNAEAMSYFELKQLVEQQCVPDSLLMFLNSPLKQGALRAVNELMQQHRAYVLYSNSSTISENGNSQNDKND